MSNVFKPMRSIAPDPKYPVRYMKLGSPKLDGIRACKYLGSAVTKSVKPVPNKHIRAWMETSVPEGVDGELISGPPTESSCYGKTFTAVMTQEGVPDFNFYVFDLCNRPDLRSSERKKLLKEMCKTLDSRIIFVEQTPVYSDAEAETLYAKFIALGYEGMMLVDPDGYYKYGKATAKQQEQLKFKPEEDYEAEILETYEAMINENEAFTNEAGETDRSTHAENKVGKGMVGGYVVRDVLTKATFKVGAGRLSHKDRIEEWIKVLANPNHRKGTYLKYRSMTYGDMTNGAARHGRWIGWRDTTDMNPEDLKGSV